MQNTFRFIHSLRDKGISVSMVGDFLKVKPKARLTDEIRTEIKKRKGKLSEALWRVEADVLRGGKQSPCSSCWHCLYYDGAGSSWPGRCRYFEQIGQEAKEIDSKAVNPDKGCRFFQEAVKEAVFTPDEQSGCSRNQLSTRVKVLQYAGERRSFVGVKLL